jgi:hypothetical protein
MITPGLISTQNMFQVQCISISMCSPAVIGKKPWQFRMCQDGPKKCHGNGMQWPSPSIDLGPQAFLPKSEALATSTSHGTPAARISTLRVLPVPVSPETSTRRRGFTWFHTLNCKKYSIPVNSALCPNNPEHTLLARPTFMMRLVTLEQHGPRPRPRPRR